MKRCIYCFFSIALSVCLLPAESKAIDNTAFQDTVMSKQCPTGGAEAEKLYQLGRQYREGHGMPLDKKKAEQLFNQALAMGNAKAAIQIGQMYMSDFSPISSSAQREKNMLAMYKQSAEMGCPEAYMALAEYYGKGWGAQKDKKKTDEYLLKAADMGAPKAMEFWGMYILEQDRREEARRFFEKSVALGNADAYIGIATIHQNAGESTGLINALRTGAKGGSKACISKLNLIYSVGMFGQTVDIEYADKFSKFHKNMSDFTAPTPIPDFDKRFPPKAVLPFKGRYADKHSDGKSLEDTSVQECVISQQCPTGGAEAEKLYHLGRQYDHGYEVPRDKKKAEQLYNQALAMGNAMAAIRIGQMYKNSFLHIYTVDERKKNTIAMYKKAAKMGCPEAYMHLAVEYGTGWGLKTNEKKASEHLRKAADMGSPKAMELWGMLILRQGQTEEARHNFEKSIALGNADAHNGIAAIYQYAKDLPRLINALRDGAKGGSKKCIKKLYFIYSDGKLGQTEDTEYSKKLLELFESINTFNVPTPVPDFDKRFPPKPVLPYGAWQK